MTANTTTTLLAALLAVAGAGPAAASAPVVRVVGDTVTVEALDAGTTVALLGITRRTYGTIPGFERWDGTAADDDRDGRVTVELAGPVEAGRSVWLAVDLANGDWAVWGSLGIGFPAPTPTAEELPAGSASWTVRQGRLEALVVRPGAGAAAGAWGGSVWDGGPADGDGRPDGAVGVTPARLEPVVGVQAGPATLEAGDLLVAIDAESLLASLARVTAPEGVLP